MFTRSEKLLLFLMAAINFTHLVDFVMMMPMGPQLQRVFHISSAQFGLLVSSYSFAAGASGFLCSFFIDRFDRKSLLLFFYTGFALGTLACAVSSSYELLLISRSFTGAFGGILGSLILAITSDVISVERRGTAMGVIMGAFSVASVAGVPFSLYLANHFDWQAPFIALGVFAIVLSLLTFIKMPPMRDHLEIEAMTSQPRDLFIALKRIFADSNQLFALCFMFSLVFGQFCIIPFLSHSFIFNGGLKESELPLIYLSGGLVSMIASPAFGRLSDRYGRKNVFLGGALASIGPMLVITNIGPMASALIILLSCSFFLVMSGRMVPSMALISSAAPPRYRASFMSISSCVQQLALSLSSYYAGLVVYQGSDGRLLRFELMGWTGVVFTLSALILVGKIRSVESRTT